MVSFDGGGVSANVDVTSPLADVVVGTTTAGAVVVVVLTAAAVVVVYEQCSLGGQLCIRGLIGTTGGEVRTVGTAAAFVVSSAAAAVVVVVFAPAAVVAARRSEVTKSSGGDANGLNRSGKNKSAIEAS